MDPVVLLVFLFVYAGMIAGGIPHLALDRTGVALLGAIALLAFGKVSPDAARDAVDVSTIALLFGLMVVSAQFRLGGFYTRLTARLAAASAGPAALLGMLIAVAGVLSAVLANDIVCLAMAPILAAGCARRGLDPVPFLLGLACASNVGSAATLIGNPQNMLIGQTLHMSFSGYLLDALVPSLLGLAATWGVLLLLYRGRFRREMTVPEPEAPRFSAWQTGKGAVVTGVLMALFIAVPWPREVLALCAAGVLLLSRRMASRRMLALVDWQLLVLFVALFVVNSALAASGMLQAGMEAMTRAGVDPREPAALFGSVVVLSNLVSNVPATMLLLPAAVHPQAGAILALASTLAGNLIIVGSIANIIVVDQAGRLGVRISWAAHARVGVPVTLSTLAIAALWLALV
ncbi:MAG: anion transporter [Planctomycetes bacterium]|jgi:Na+/H+ antiporter NhaD/arsenite permease-like protein|nr:anion transporter [Planctomycetota bacterium]